MQRNRPKLDFMRRAFNRLTSQFFKTRTPDPLPLLEGEGPEIADAITGPLPPRHTKGGRSFHRHRSRGRIKRQAERVFRYATREHATLPKGFRSTPARSMASAEYAERAKDSERRPRRNRHKNRIWRKERLSNGEKMAVANHPYTEDQLFLAPYERPADSSGLDLDAYPF